MLSPIRALWVPNWLVGAFFVNTKGLARIPHLRGKLLARTIQTKTNRKKRGLEKIKTM